MLDLLSDLLEKVYHCKIIIIGHQTGSTKPFIEVLLIEENDADANYHLLIHWPMKQSVKLSSTKLWSSDLGWLWSTER